MVQFKRHLKWHDQSIMLHHIFNQGGSNRPLCPIGIDLTHTYRIGKDVGIESVAQTASIPVVQVFTVPRSDNLELPCRPSLLDLGEGCKLPLAHALVTVVLGQREIAATFLPCEVITTRSPCMAV